MRKLAIVALLGLAATTARAEDFQGIFDLVGKTNAGKNANAALTIKKNGSAYEVARVSSSGTWSSSVVRVDKSRMVVSYRVAVGGGGTTSVGFVGALGLSSSASADDELAALASENVFDAIYDLAKDGKIRETVLNRTKLGGETWTSIKGNGARRVVTAPALTYAEFRKQSYAKIQAWYVEHLKEVYEDRLKQAKTSAEKALLKKQWAEDLANKPSVAVDNDETASVREEIDGGSPVLDANGRAVPRWAISALSASFYPEYAGIGLSKTFVFDRRTAEIVRENDISD